jgi:hypothetical protein
MKNAMMDLLFKKGDMIPMLKGSPSYNSFSYAQNTNIKVTIFRPLETMIINEASVFDTASFASSNCKSKFSMGLSYVGSSH